MNTKIYYISLVSIVAILISACQPNFADNSVSVDTQVQPSNVDNAVVIPVTGNDTSEFVERDVQEPRLWSGEVFMSDNNAPDYGSYIIPNTGEDAKDECISEDDTPRRHGGCIE